MQPQTPQLTRTSSRRLELHFSPSPKPQAPASPILFSSCKDSAPTEKHHNSNQTTTITNVPAIKQQRSMQPQTPQLTRSSSRTQKLHCSASPKQIAPASPILLLDCKDSAQQEQKTKLRLHQTKTKTFPAHNKQCSMQT